METSKIKKSLLPELFSLSGEWEPYQEALYNVFKETLLKRTLYFQGLRVGIRRVPEYKGRHYVFWHLTSEGEKEEERIPDLRRCERLAWVSFIIENYDTNPEISWWENTRKSKKHVVIWHEKENYAIVLALRNNYYLLKTAYITDKNRARTFRKERERFNKNKLA